MPIDVLAKRGPKTLLFGTMKPVGLVNPEGGGRPYAVVQLRQDDAACRLMNIVGFQTRLARPEQERVFAMIPALAHAEYARYGTVHRNTFLNAPAMLTAEGRLKAKDNVFTAGQITGVEGYVESAASGLAAGIGAGLAYRRLPVRAFPPATALGSLLRYIATADVKHFQPMNVNFGLMPQLPAPPGDKKRRSQMYAERALEALDRFLMEQ